MIVLLLTFSLFHVLSFLLLTRYWVRIPTHNFTLFKTGVSILIPVRNEGESIKQILTDLSNQDYPENLYEVIVIDDHSDDNTSFIAAEHMKSLGLNGKVIELDNESVGKKAASTMGVKEAKFDIIVCTDADCHLQKKWLSNHTSCYLDKKTKMVTGPVLMKGDSLLESIQVIEFTGLIGYGAVTLDRGYPSMCNGANMSYVKEAFEEVEGYLGNDHIATGDDEFLLQKISQKFEGSIKFLKDQDSIVETPAKKRLVDLLEQRVRWTSKWRFHKSKFIWFTSFLVFFNFLLGSILIPYAIISGSLPLIGAVILKWISELFYFGVLSSFFKVRLKPLLILLLSIIYPYYALFLGIASIFGRYSWKGRRYNDGYRISGNG